MVARGLLQVNWGSDDGVVRRGDAVVSALAAEATAQATTLQLWGAGLFGAVLGWFTYFVNRHRTEDVKLSDVAALLGAVGGAAVLALFPAGTDLFAAYGIGLAAGFFGYFLLLLVLVWRSKAFGVDWLLDGRAPAPKKSEVRAQSHAFGPGQPGSTDPTGIQ